MIVTSFELSNTFWLIIKCNVWLGKYTKSEFICWGVGWGNIFLLVLMEDLGFKSVFFYNYVWHFKENKKISFLEFFKLKIIFSLVIIRIDQLSN